LHSYTALSINLNNFEEAEKKCIEGFETSSKYGRKTEQYTFAAFLHFIKSKENSTNRLKNTEGILKYYYKIKKEMPGNIWTDYLENAITSFYNTQKSDEILGILNQQINTNIMHGDIIYAIYWRFILSNERYLKEIYRGIITDYSDDLDFPEMIPVENKLIDDIGKTCDNTLCYRKAIKSERFAWDIYKLQLMACFFTEKNNNFEEAAQIVKKMESIITRKQKANTYKTYSLLRVSLKMLEHSASTKQMLDKYELKLKKIIEGFKEAPAECGTIDYAILSSLARRLRCRAVTQMVREFYHWLSSKHPEILAPVMREIEERKAKIYVVDGSKQSAA
jgi:hypothetical protein